MILEEKYDLIVVGGGHAAVAANAAATLGSKTLLLLGAEPFQNVL